MKQRLLAFSFCSFIALLFSTSSFSQVNYYVSTSGSDANAGTSLAAPFATLAKAISKATAAGDTIFVRSGTYAVSTTIKISKSGTAAKHIVLTVYKPDMVDASSRPVFDFSAMAANSANRGFQLSGVSYWDIYGIVIKGAGDNGMNIDGGGDYNTPGAGYITITFCSFTRNRDTGLQIGGREHNVNVINCDSYENADLGTGTTTQGGNADGFTPKLDPGDTIVFRGCRAWLNSDDGWDGYLKVKASDTGAPGDEPDNMTTFLEDCWSFRNGYYWLNGTTTTSENGNGFKLGGSANKDEAHNFVLIRCLSFYNKAKGFDQNNSAGSQYIYNCSAYKNGDNDFGLNSSGVTYTAGATLVLENNLSLGAKGVSIPSSSTGTRKLVTATNSFKTATTSAEILSFDTTGISGPRDVNGNLPTLNFMHLNVSAATPYTYIDKGTVVDTVEYHDAEGIPYIGNAPDLGAFESISGTVPVSMLSFSAFSNNSSVTLNWKMASEINNKGWTIQRASANDLSMWSNIGFLNGAGNSSLATDYSFLDQNISSGTYYYRLMQVDLSGHVTYSSIITVKLDGNKKLEITGYPNPFRSSSTVRYTVEDKGLVSLRVYNAEGSLLGTLVQENQQPGTYQKLMNGESLPNGKYFLRLTVGNKTTTTTLIKE